MFLNLARLWRSSLCGTPRAGEVLQCAWKWKCIDFHQQMYCPREFWEPLGWKIQAFLLKSSILYSKPLPGMDSWPSPLPSWGVPPPPAKSFPKRKKKKSGGF
jgi:hypothetical protein